MNNISLLIFSIIVTAVYVFTAQTLIKRTQYYALKDPLFSGAKMFALSIVILHTITAVVTGMLWIGYLLVNSIYCLTFDNQINCFFVNSDHLYTLYGACLLIAYLIITIVRYNIYQNMRHRSLREFVGKNRKIDDKSSIEVAEKEFYDYYYGNML